MKRWKIFVLVLVCMILVLVGWFYLAAMGVERTVLSSDYYHNLSVETDITGQLHEGLQEQMQAQLPQDMPEEFTGVLVKSAALAFHEDWFQDQFLLVVDDFLAWIKGEQEAPAAIIDLREGKVRFEEALLNNLEEIAGNIEQGFPFEMQGNLDADQQLEVVVQEIMQEIDLPDEIMLADVLMEELSPAAEENITRLQSYRVYSLYMPYLLFALLLLSCYFLAGLAGGLQWFGAAVLFAGATFFLGLQLFLGVHLTSSLVGLEGELPLKAEALSSAAGYTAARISTAPLIFAAVGLALLVGGTALGKVQRKT